MSGRTAALARVGRALGGLAWVQGPGGNVSVKDRGALHVKASGTRLADLGAPGTLATVPLALADRALGGDATAAEALFARTPRPSLETWFHALPGRYVVHTHPLAVLLVACADMRLPDGVADIAPSLPGRDVALAMQAAGDVDAWILRSHGLVVRAASAVEALRLSRAIARSCLRLADVAARQLPTLPPMHVGRAPGGLWMALPPRPFVPSPVYLFPDAAVLAAVRPVAVADADAVTTTLAADPRPGVLHTPDGSRLAFARTAPQLRDVVEVATAHDWLRDMLGTAARPLPPAMVHAIVDMPAEKFRQTGRDA